MMPTEFPQESPQTPTGAIRSVTATSDGNISIRFGVVVPNIRYLDCGVILLPPGDSGIDSSAQAKLWRIGLSTGFAYNNSIHIGISPPNPNEYVGISSQHGVDNDSLTINCSTLGKVPDGKWMLFLVYLPTEGSIVGATWHMNGVPITDQSLAFSSLDNIDAMKDYGFAFVPGLWGYWYFWDYVFVISLVFFISLAVALLVITVQVRRRKEE
jgi:hypothetical protein